MPTQTALDRAKTSSKDGRTKCENQANGLKIQVEPKKIGPEPIVLLLSYVHIYIFTRRCPLIFSPKTAQTNRPELAAGPDFVSTTAGELRKHLFQKIPAEPPALP